MSDMISFAGGNGAGLGEAIIIRGALDTAAGVQAEYGYLDRLLGRRGIDWQIVRQSLLHRDGRSYDHMEVRLADGTTRAVVFDITEFFGQ